MVAITVFTASCTVSKPHTDTAIASGSGWRQTVSSAAGCVTPAWTTASRSSTLTNSTWFIWLRSTETPPSHRTDVPLDGRAGAERDDRHAKPGADLHDRRPPCCCARKRRGRAGAAGDTTHRCYGAGERRRQRTLGRRAARAVRSTPPRSPQARARSRQQQTTDRRTLASSTLPSARRRRASREATG